MTINMDMIYDAVRMFLYLGVELTVLYLVFSYLVGILQNYIPPERIEKILSSKNGRGYAIAALMGAGTMFCSCSTIPFLKGLLRANAGFGPMMTFLISSPLLNPVVVGLLIPLFGLKITLYYVTVSFAVSILAGITMERLGLESEIKTTGSSQEGGGCGCTSEPATTVSACACSSRGDAEYRVSCCASSAAISAEQPVISNIWLDIWKGAWSDFTKAFPYLLIGIVIGSVIYGFVPTELIARYAGSDNPFAVPVASIIGVPLYIRASSIIPISAGLMAKGMGTGAVMALIIGSAGASLTEVILLKSMFRNRIIAVFLAIVFGMAVFSGYTVGFLM